MDKITTSAPGKLILLGEHSVVYNNPCLVASVNKRIFITVEKSKQDDWTDKKFVEKVVKNFRQKFSIFEKVKITINSEFSQNYGLGSSSAITVAAAYGLYKLLLDKAPSKEELFSFCYQVVLEVQGVSSGFDIAAAVYGGILYFQTAGKIIEPLSAYELPLIVAYSGTKADTVTMVKTVKEKMTTHKQGVEEIFKNISNLVEEAKISMIEKDWIRLGTLMNFNQDYLEDIGVSTEKLDDMIIAAKNAGAYGAKLSGAGGGDCIIALASAEKRKNIEDAITKAGGEILDVKITSEGVKIEG